MPQNKNLHFFLGANTPLGFVSRFEQLADVETGWHSFVIKGGPGTGKSSMIKCLASSCSERCENIEQIHCSSDVDSLDGLILVDQKISIADGTPPHVIEPQYPGAFERLVVLNDSFDNEQLNAHRTEIVKISKQITATHKQCCRYLGAAASLMNDTHRFVLDSVDTEKIARTASRIATVNFKKLDKISKEKVRFLSAVTNKGPIIFEETATQLCDKIVLLADEHGVCSSLLLAAIKQHAIKAGLDIITCYSIFSPFERIEHLFIPEIKLGFMTQNDLFELTLQPSIVMHSSRFMNKERLNLKKQHIKFNRKASGQMIDQAVKLLADAKIMHDELETYYGAAVNFEKVNEITQRVSKEFIHLSNLN